jgi:ferrochelatase
MAKQGILLLNIGSPDSYQVEDVKKYLKRFLMDKNVISLPFIFRWPLVNLLIVPKRAPFSASNYKKVWMANGSPLVVHSKNFATKLQTELGTGYQVEIGMAYGSPFIREALQKLQRAGIENLLVIPMFPQWAQATTGSILGDVKKFCKELNFNVPTRIVQDFYTQESFIETSAALTKEHAPQADHYLFSFHGLPVAQVKAQSSSCALNDGCCVQQGACDKPCYRAQCSATASAIAKKLGLAQDQWSLSFQSRLGRAEWLTPSTDSALAELAKKDRSNIAVICPSFVADCIETLEEIGDGGRHDFENHGGKSFTLVPCVNDNPQWVRGFAKFVVSKCVTV